MPHLLRHLLFKKNRLLSLVEKEVPEILSRFALQNDSGGEIRTSEFQVD